MTLEQRVRKLEQRLERLNTIPQGNNIVRSATTAVPPDDSDLDTSFGSAIYPGFIGGFRDSINGKFYLVLRESSLWYYIPLIQAGTGLIDLSAGVADAVKGTITVHGAGAGSVNGGELRLEMAADHDGTYNYWSVKVNEDDLLIGPEGATLLTLIPTGVGIGATPTLPLQVYSTGIAARFDRETATGGGNVTMQLHNADVTDENNTGIGFVTATDGAGGVAAQNMGLILCITSEHDHATRVSRLEFRTSSSGNPTTKMTIHGDGSIVVGSPTGGAKGAGTVNAVGVYDDNVLLTDYLFDLFYDDRMRPDDTAKHPDARLWTIKEMANFTREHRHLPTMPGRDEWEQGAKSLGELVTALWATVEQQQLQIYELEKRINEL